MSEISTEILAAGVMIYCTTGCQAKGAIAEFSSDADNYQGEILGGILIQLILRAASQGCTLEYQLVVIHCANKGVVNHGNSPGRSLGENNRKLVYFAVCRTTSRSIPLSLASSGCLHIKTNTSREDCTLMEQLNIIVD